MGHSHAGHDHHDSGSASRRSLAFVLALTATFTVVEVIGGLLTGSLALLADAGHMLSDNLALAMALGASWLATRPATPERSFGFRRAEILAALVNGLTLVGVSVWISYEAIRRFADPSPVLGGPMLAVAALGLAVNVVGAIVLFRSVSRSGESLNVEGAARHVFADALGSVGAIAAAIIILTTGWRYADPLVSLVIALLILASSWKLLKDSTNVLLEAAPPGLDAREIGNTMISVAGVSEVHDLHVWTITSGFPALAAHVLVPPSEDCHEARRSLEKMLVANYGIEHTTLQVDHIGDHAPHGLRFLTLSAKPDRDADHHHHAE
ncbi:MAG: cation diffusion facilitator family transporter [Rubrobacter sp.]